MSAIAEELLLVESDTKYMSIDKYEFVRGLEKVLPAVWRLGKEAGFTRPAMEGVLFEQKGLECNIVATDTYRLHKYILPSCGVEHSFILCDNKKACLPGTEPLTSIVKKIKKSRCPDDVSIYTGETYCQILHNGISYVASVVDGQFPNYRKVMPTEKNFFAYFMEYQIDGIREELRNILDGAKLNKKAVFMNYDNEEHQKLYFNLYDDGFTVEAGPNFSEYVSKLYKTSTGFEMRLAYNGCFLQDLFNAVGRSDDTYLSFEPSYKDAWPIIVESGQFTGVLMPMLP